MSLMAKLKAERSKLETEAEEKGQGGDFKERRSEN